MTQYRIRVFCFCLLLLALAGCGRESVTSEPGPRRAKYAPVALFTPLEEYAARPLDDAEALALARQLSPKAQGLSSWKDLDAAVAGSLAFASKRPANAVAFSYAGRTATWGEMVKGQQRLRELLPLLDETPDLLVRGFYWVRLGPDFSFTGYYEPTLRASRRPTADLPHPLYRKPPELKNGQPYFTRHEIDRKGALRGRNLEIAYVDETDAYFLQVQGSGRLRFEDGSSIHVLYAGKNNRSYASLGRLMREKGLLPEDGANMRAIRRYLAENPAERAALFDENASYVFFRPETYGPIGSMGHVLTPWVSLAVDRKVIPQGSLAMVLAPLPGPDGAHTEPFPALTLPQDSGGAIKGNRIDLFCGAADDAAHVAGHLDIRGAVYILLPR